MNKSSIKFDDRLLAIEHYQNFPCMMPYIGKNYGPKKKIMLIAESHYLPFDSTISQDPRIWYKANQQDLNNTEKAWISTRDILAGDWTPPGHMIFKELNTRMNGIVGSKNSRPMTNVVVMNAFQRPAPESGESIKNFSCVEDFKVGAKTVQQVIEITEPDLVLFVSKYSWDNIRWKLPKNSNIQYDYVCHPGTGGRYWHNHSYMHGVNKFKNILEVFSRD